MASTSKSRLVLPAPQKKKTVPNVFDDFDDDELLRLADATELEHVPTSTSSSAFVVKVGPLTSPFLLTLFFHEICSFRNNLFCKLLLIWTTLYTYILCRIKVVLAMEALCQPFRIPRDMMVFISVVQSMMKKLNFMIPQTIFLMQIWSQMKYRR